MKSWKFEVWRGLTLIETISLCKNCPTSKEWTQWSKLIWLWNNLFPWTIFIFHHRFMRKIRHDSYYFFLLLLRIIQIYFAENFENTVFSVQRTEIDVSETMPLTIKQQEHKNYLQSTFQRIFLLNHDVIWFWFYFFSFIAAYFSLQTCLIEKAKSKKAK